MRVLVVEDDTFKSDNIIEIVDNAFGAGACCLARSVSEAVGAIGETQFDLVIIDMALPSHPALPGGGSPLSLLTGGLEVLFELQARGRRDRCVVITQYPEIEICGEFFPVLQASAEIQRQFEVRVVACIEYGEANTTWRASLMHICEDI